MVTLSQMHTRLHRNLRGGDVMTEEASLEYTDAINDAIAFYTPERLWFQEINQNVTITDGVIDMPENFAFDSPYSLSLTDDVGNTYPLEKLSTDWLNRVDGINGQPYGFIYDAGVYKLDPVPEDNADYTVNVRGWKSYPSLSTGAQTNDWLTYAVKLVESKATSYLWPDESGDGERGIEYAQRAAAELGQLKKMTDGKRRKGSLRPNRIADMNHYYRGRYGLRY